MLYTETHKNTHTYRAIDTCAEFIADVNERQNANVAIFKRAKQHHIEKDEGGGSECVLWLMCVNRQIEYIYKYILLLYIYTRVAQNAKILISPA